MSSRHRPGASSSRRRLAACLDLWRPASISSMSTTWRRGIWRRCAAVASASDISWVGRTCAWAKCSRTSPRWFIAGRPAYDFPYPRSIRLRSAPNGSRASPDARRLPLATGCAWRAITCSSMTPRRAVSLAIPRGPIARRLPMPSLGSRRRGICAKRQRSSRTPAVGTDPPSLLGLTRQSIHLCKNVLRRRWMRGSSPRMTSHEQLPPVSVRGLPALAQEAEKFESLAQPPPQRLWAFHHLARDGGDLRRTEIEPFVEVVHGPKNLGVAQVRVAQRCDLHTAFGQQLGILVDQPTVLQRLLVEERAGIGRGKRNLNRMRVDLDREADCLLDRFLGLARQPEDEGAMGDDAKLPAIPGEALGDVDPHSLLDVVKDLLVAGFVADEQQPQSVVLQHLQG